VPAVASPTRTSPSPPASPLSLSLPPFPRSIGKTTLTSAWAAGGAPPATPPAPTLGADVFTREVAVEVSPSTTAAASSSSGGGRGTPAPARRPCSAARRLTVQAWDVGGRDAAALLGRAFWAGAAGAVLCYDPLQAGGAPAVLAGLEHWVGVLEARASVGGRRPPVAVVAVVKVGAGPAPPSVLAAARRWCAARARAPHFHQAASAGGGGAASSPAFAAAVDAAARAGLAYAEGQRAAYWGAGDGAGAATQALAAGLAGVAAAAAAAGAGGGKGGGGVGAGGVAVLAEGAAH